jgi:hypothetical protein
MLIKFKIMILKTIKTKKDYQVDLKRLDIIFDAKTWNFCRKRVGSAFYPY